MGKNHDMTKKPSRLIGPEDLKVGQYVTVAETTWQLLCPSEDVPCAGGPGVGVEPRLAHVTGWADGAGWPLRVIGVCLPFAFAQTATGDHVSLDLRRHRLSRLSRAYGDAVFGALKKPESAPAAATDAG